MCQKHRHTKKWVVLLLVATVWMVAEMFPLSPPPYRRGFDCRMSSRRSWSFRLLFASAVTRQHGILESSCPPTRFLADFSRCCWCCCSCCCCCCCCFLFIFSICWLILPTCLFRRPNSSVDREIPVFIRYNSPFLAWKKILIWVQCFGSENLLTVTLFSPPRWRKPPLYGLWRVGEISCCHSWCSCCCCCCYCCCWCCYRRWLLLFLVKRTSWSRTVFQDKSWWLSIQGSRWCQNVFTWVYMATKHKDSVLQMLLRLFLMTSRGISSRCFQSGWT